MIGKTTSKISKASASSTAKKAPTSQLRSLIEKRAYQLFQKRGFSHGNDQGDWYEAERQILREIR